MLLAAFIWHMFAAVLGIGPGAADADEGGPAPSQRRGSAAQHRNKSVQLNAKLEMGERALFFFSASSTARRERTNTWTTFARRSQGAQAPPAHSQQPLARSQQPLALCQQPLALSQQALPTKRARVRRQGAALQCCRVAFGSVF